MKKKYNILSIGLLAMVGAIGLSSCLKDNRYINFGASATTVSFATGGLLNFSSDAVTADVDTITVQVNVATAKPNTSSTTVTIAVDPTLITSYVASNPGVPYLALPASAYKLSSTTVTVPAGQNYAPVQLIVYKNTLDPTLSYMLPIKIVSSSPSYTIASNFAVHYYHVIGNDFAGLYTHYYTRYNASDSVTVAASPLKQSVNIGGAAGGELLGPVTPTQFEVHAGYYTGPRYEVTYTKTGTGATATYSNFAVTFNSDDLKAATTASGGGVTYNAPAFAAPQSGGIDPTATYTKAQVLQRLKFIDVAASSGSPRYSVDQYVPK